MSCAYDARCLQKGEHVSYPRSWHGSSLLAKAVEARKHQATTYLICTDIDGTLVHRPDWGDTDVAVYGPLVEAVTILSAPLIGITGVNVANVIERIGQHDVPVLDAIAGSVGTDLWIMHRRNPGISVDVLECPLPDGGQIYYVRDESFQEQLVAIGFDRRAIVMHAMEWIASHTGDTALGLTFQQPEAEHRFIEHGGEVGDQAYKVSFHCFDHTDDFLVIRALAQEAADLFGHRVVICEEKGYNSQLKPGERPLKFNLDILPVTKADTVRYLQQQLQADTVVTAGDSGNDLALLAEAGDLKVVVGGATPELLREVAHITQLGQDAGVFRTLAELDRQVYWYVERTHRRGPQSLHYALTEFHRLLVTV